MGSKRADEDERLIMLRSRPLSSDQIGPLARQRMREDMAKEATKAKAKGQRGTGLRTILIGALSDGKEHQFKDLLLSSRQEYEKTHGKIPEGKPFKIGRVLAGLKNDGNAKQVKAKRGFWVKATPKPKKSKKVKKAAKASTEEGPVEEEEQDGEEGES